MANEKRMDQVILGLLSHEPLTGYEIKKRIDKALKYFWGGSYGSIYPTLNQLEKQGFIAGTDSEDSGRNKKYYSITEEGHEHLKDWLGMPVVKDELRYETMLKLFFGNEVGSEMTLAHVEAFEQKIKAELPLLEHSVEILEKAQSEKTHTYYMLTAMFGVKTYQAYLKWCEEAKEILKQNRKDEK